MEIGEETKGAALLLTLNGRLDSNTAPGLEAVLPARIEQQETTIIDLSHVSYVSSAGLRVLLKGAKTARATHRHLILSGLSASVREVFDISGFSSIFAIEPDIDAALRAVG
ncbi:STAS domain-containing protein [Sphingopyxis flava]|uniref:Anti-sigma factor antagonist n=1 Tax=Sphingopyxis flava TaxID=1507287 RepID=A0A1T5BHZ8_9SPHN|nr:STAS domain-containing protein [Sphingopyxis flava]SKB46942.1 anti-sigma B factor antagonist [Sphingopyxis flava]